ncbi:MAG: TaqI-like C-terminal specificity domain-containing protein, partial [Promethearchaeota archaeon]
QDRRRPALPDHPPHGAPQKLLRGGGRLGFIVSNKVLAADYGTPLRELLVSSLAIEQMVDISQLEMFEGASTYPHIIIIRKPRRSIEAKENETLLLSRLKVSDGVIQVPSQAERVPQRFFQELPNCILSPALSVEKFRIIERMRRNTTLLSEVLEINCGIARTGFSKHVLTKTQYSKLAEKEKQVTRPFLTAGDVLRYSTRKKGYLTYSAALATPEQWQEFGEPKILFAGIGKHLRVALDQEGCALGRVYYSILKKNPVNPYFLIAVLNSRLVNAYYSLLFGATHLRGGYIRYNATYLQKIPIPPSTESRQEAELVELATQAIQKPSLLKQGLDSKINQCVASLYGLKPEEVTVLEG